MDLLPGLLDTLGASVVAAGLGRGKGSRGTVRMGVCANAAHPNRIQRGTSNGFLISPPSGRGGRLRSCPTDSQLSRSVAGRRGFTESCTCRCDLCCACAQGGVVFFFGYLGAGGAELVLCQSFEALFGVADGFQDPRATSVAMLSPWTRLAESYGVVTLWTPNCVSMRGQV